MTCASIMVTPGKPPPGYPFERGACVTVASPDVARAGKQKRRGGIDRQFRPGVGRSGQLEGGPSAAGARASARSQSPSSIASHASCTRHEARQRGHGHRRAVVTFVAKRPRLEGPVRGGGGQCRRINRQRLSRGCGYRWPRMRQVASTKAWASPRLAVTALSRASSARSGVPSERRASSEPARLAVSASVSSALRAVSQAVAMDRRRPGRHLLRGW